MEIFGLEVQGEPAAADINDRRYLDLHAAKCIYLSWPLLLKQPVNEFLADILIDQC